MRVVAAPIDFPYRQPVTDHSQLAKDDALQPLDLLARAALAHYDVPQQSALNLINLSENATYGVTAPDGRRWALRLHRPGYHSGAAIASELAWATALRRDGAATTPVPVPGRDGEWIQLVRHTTAEPRHAVLFHWEEGREPQISDDLKAAFEVLGSAAARMHAHVQSWQRPSWFTRFTWDFETALGDRAPHWGRWRDGMGLDPSSEALFARTASLIDTRLAAYGKSAQRFGLVHGDLRLANLLVDGDMVKVIDFDDCGFSWFMYDAATPVSFYEHEPQVPELLDHWKVGYRRVAPLAAADEAEIPTFVMFRRLLLVAWIGSHRHTPLAQDMGPAYTRQTGALCEHYLSTMG